MPHLSPAYLYFTHCRCRSEYEDSISLSALPVEDHNDLVEA
jgi:hypothetical protein